MKIENANTQFGLPVCDAVSDDILQQYDDTCAIKSQEIILNAAGIDISEGQLRQEAFDNGWYKPGEGTPMADVGNLLEVHGIEANRQINCSIINLVSELSKGHPVIVGVDSGELWNPGPDETLEDLIHGPCADHALLVSGIEFNDDFSDGTVSLIDPGTGDFSKGYNLNDFCDAWTDSDNFMVTIS